MRVQPIWIVLCVAVAGCDGAGSANAPSNVAAGLDTDGVAPGPPMSIDSGSLRLYRDPQVDANKLAIGEKVANDDTIFPPPATSKHVVQTPLPKGFSPDLYAANGWELADGTEGCGLISNANTREVVAAIVRHIAPSQSDADSIVEAYKEKSADKVRQQDIIYSAAKYGDNAYSFWEEGGIRLMILESPGKGDKVQMTLILGTKSILSFLRADPALARIDGVAVASTMSATAKP